MVLNSLEERGVKTVLLVLVARREHCRNDVIRVGDDHATITGGSGVSRMTSYHGEEPPLSPSGKRCHLRATVSRVEDQGILVGLSNQYP